MQITLVHCCKAVIYSATQQKVKTQISFHLKPFLKTSIYGIPQEYILGPIFFPEVGGRR